MRSLSSLSFLGVALVFASRASGAPPPVATPVLPLPTRNEHPDRPPNPERLAVVRFTCDQKYSADPCDEATWLARVLLDPWSGPDLLMHEEGGPRGAVWNGDAPMVVFVRATEGAVSLGQGTKLKGTSAGAYRWFRVPREQWYRALRGDENEPHRRFAIRVGRKVAGEVWYAEGE